LLGGQETAEVLSLALAAVSCPPQTLFLSLLPKTPGQGLQGPGAVLNEHFFPVFFLTLTGKGQREG